MLITEGERLLKFKTFDINKMLKRGDKYGKTLYKRGDKKKTNTIL